MLVGERLRMGDGGDRDNWCMRMERQGLLEKYCIYSLSHWEEGGTVDTLAVAGGTGCHVVSWEHNPGCVQRGLCPHLPMLCLTHREVL